MRQLAAICLLLSTTLYVMPQSAPIALPSTAAAPSKNVLEDGTPIRLTLQETISSKDAKTGQEVAFQVVDDLYVNGYIVISRGAVAKGTVTDALPARRMGRAGKLNVNIDSVRLNDDEKVALRAVKDVKGGSHVGAMTGAIVATAIVFFPAAPLFLLIHGKNIVIPQGTPITSFVNGTVKLDPAKFTPPAQTGAAASLTAAALPIKRISIISAPPGGDIDVDGNFVGNTLRKWTYRTGPIQSR
jgi:hypothetical protein